MLLLMPKRYLLSSGSSKLTITMNHSRYFCIPRFCHLLILCSALLILSSCSQKRPIETLMEAYWGALAQGDVATAYALLSAEDKTYIDLETFEVYLRDQPSLNFLLLPLETEVFMVEADIASVSINRNHASVIMTVQAPALDRWLGDNLAKTLHGATDKLPEAQLAAEKRLAQKLTIAGVSLPIVNSTHTLRLIKERQGWRVTFPRWRAEAMLARAKSLSAEKRLEDALKVLEKLSHFPDELDPVSKLSTIKEARRGRRMLPYLTRVRLEAFKRVERSAHCHARATMQVRNTGELAIKFVSGVIEFLDNAGEPLGQQSIELQKQAGLITSEINAEFDLCLEPPRNWSGKANAWVSWLVFSEEVYKTHID